MIKFAGVPVLLPTPQIEAYISALRSPVFSVPTADARLGAAWPSIPVPNWTPRFPPRVNSLVWPSGASRWASMYLLVTDEQMDAIETATHVSSGGIYVAAGGQLVIADSRWAAGDTIGANGWTRGSGSNGKRIALSTEMFALDPRPLALPFKWVPGEEEVPGSWEESTERTAWVLPIVDERYFWRHQSVDVPAWGNWNEALEGCAGVFGATLDISAIAEEYDELPDLEPIYQGSASLLLDSLAASIGHRIVRDFNKEVRSLSAADAATLWAANTPNAVDTEFDENPEFNTWQRVSGGESTYKRAGVLPEKIKVVFSNGATREIVDSGATQYRTGHTVTIHVGVLPAIGRIDYAEQVAADWMAWMAKSCDQTFANVKAWRMTGYEDYVEITHGSIEASPWNAITRVTTHSHYLHSSPPPNASLDTAAAADVSIHTLAIKGYPASGTIDWSYAQGLDPAITGTFDWDATAASVATALGAIPGIATLIVRGGPLPWNTIQFRLDTGLSQAVQITGNSLTRETYGMKPKPEMTVCTEPAALWVE